MGDHAWVYVGTRRSGPGTGLSRARLDVGTGRLGEPELAAVTADPAWVMVHPDGRHLYTCHSGTPGAVSAFTVDDPASGSLRLLNAHAAAGRGPSHLSLDRSGRFVLAANYHEGYVEVVALEPDGRLGASTALVRHQGRSVHPERQTSPHVHCVRVDPTNGFLLAADLGLDRIVIYQFDAATGALTAHGHTDTTPGSGPRHLAWHPDGRHVFVTCELSNSVASFVWDADAGTLALRASLPVLPEGFTGANKTSEIVVHPNGRVLYVSNRGHDSLAVGRIDPEGGSLVIVDIVDARGRMPRYMSLDATGRWLLVASHDSDSLGLFEVLEPDGRLAFVEIVRAPEPYGLAVLPIPERPTATDPPASPHARP